MKLPFLFAKRFVAGETLGQALPSVQEINNKNIAVTLDLLGEDVTDQQTADETVTEYIHLLKQIQEAGLNATISVKATMLGLSIDKYHCKENLFSLLEVAKDLGQFVRIDMEGSKHTQTTINLFKEAQRQFGNHVGIVIQAYLHRSRNDIEELADLGGDIRICKGAYNEPEDIALQNMNAIRDAYKSYVKVLLKKTYYPRIATHDDELIQWVKQYAKKENIDKCGFEFQMLYGLREQTIIDLVNEGYNARIYVPYGTMWFPYFRRRLAERKENIWFVLSTLFKQ
ncbi:proline dehydrogenase family protein [Rhodohalobacter sp. 614A]|uniref:proline dehydrogenase family protein n=1 Tax=Rhodohalobacter sp. 614A TaxID=2908649 RepID=UPI001F463497|nr:proline dehydrogenase family protein [Rhodohalobacter sp. 614A]